METQVDSVLVIVEPGNRLGPSTYQAVLRGTNFGSWILQRLWGYGTALLLWQTPYLRGGCSGRTGRPCACLFLLCTTGCWTLSPPCLTFNSPLSRTAWPMRLLQMSIYLWRLWFSGPSLIAAGTRLEGLQEFKGNVFDVTQVTQHELLCENTSASVFPACFWCFLLFNVLIKPTSQELACPLDSDANLCHNAGGRLQDDRRAGGSEGVEEVEEERIERHLHMFNMPRVPYACCPRLPLSLSSLIGSSDASWIYRYLIILLLREKQQQACDQTLLRDDWVKEKRKKGHTALLCTEAALHRH